MPSFISKVLSVEDIVVIATTEIEVDGNLLHIIDMGPEGGREGGTVVVTGTPEEVAKSGKGITSVFLEQEL